MATLWSRVWATNIGWSTGQMALGSIGPGQSEVRCHFGIRFLGITSTETDFNRLAEDFMAVGVVCQRSTRGGTAPSALTSADDVNPPLERWLWWATLPMRPLTFDDNIPGVCMWGTDATAVLGDTQSQVKANVSAGQTLDFYLTWAPWITTGWATHGTVQGSAWASTLFLV